MLEDKVRIKLRGTPGTPADPKAKPPIAAVPGDPGRIIAGEEHKAGAVVVCNASDGRLLVAMKAADYCDADGQPLVARATGPLGVSSGLVAGAPVQDTAPDGARA